MTDDTGSLTDEKLVACLADGQPRALGELYARHAARLRKLARCLVHDPGRAEDLAHDVFIEAWRDAKKYDRRRGTVISWLQVRLRSRAIDFLRTRENQLRLVKNTTAD